MSDRLIAGPDGRMRCAWPGELPDYVAYHDDEWGQPVHDDRRLFEKLCLEGFQSGLSWLTILRKRENFRAAFADFDPAVVAGYDEPEIEALLQDAGIIRHRGKIEATINNAARALELIDECGSLDTYLWSWRPTEREPDAKDPTAEFARPDRHLDRAEQGPEAAGLDVRRPHHRLRLHAGHGPRRRPRRRLRVAPRLSLPPKRATLSPWPISLKGSWTRSPPPSGARTCAPAPTSTRTTATTRR